jgi:hypothetical protein
MKKLLVLLFSILISFKSYGELVKVGESVNGLTHYIDIVTIKEHGGYVYFWDMVNRLRPTETGMLSNKIYYQGECGINRYQNLSYIFYNQPMGKGAGDTYSPTNPEWEYPLPDSMGGTKLSYVCDYVN